MAPLQFHELPPELQAALNNGAQAPLFVTGEDCLQLSTWNSFNTTTVIVSGRFKTLDGQVRPFTMSQTPNFDRTAKTTAQSLGDGWLLNLTVLTSGGNPFPGQTFARLQLVRGLGSSGAVFATIAAGYVNAVQPLAWPGSPVANTLDGAGFLRSITGTTPAAGGEISDTVPAGARWEVLSVTFQLITAVAVANRNVDLILDDGVFTLHRVGAAINQAASITKLYQYSQGFGTPFSGVVATVNSYLPGNNRLGAASRIRTSTTNIQAADQFSAVQYLVREWLEAI